MDIKTILLNPTLITAVIGALIGGGFATVGAFWSRRSTKETLILTERQLALTHAVKIADFRQQWINDLRETMAKWQSFSVFPRENETPKEREEVAQEFSRLRAKVFFLMDRKDTHYEELALLMCSPGDSRPETYSDPFIVLCQKILKAEWEKLKKDLAMAAKPENGK